MSARRLTDKELAKYEKILLKEKEETLKILQKIDDIQKKGSKNRTGDSSSYSLHQADLGTDTDESEKRVFYLNRQNDKLKKIIEALKRIYDKTYGLCEICGERISHKRLEIVPYAKFCIDCKAKEEKNNRRYR
ncbi:MAG: hypothetical protein B6D62_04200 [Candidatus Cloacimonas sp. 4484_275]|nr:MAG: hypothetical protein B6D62_04200 [Candidatus Cloacimonas sp. 4484_275]